MPLFDLKQDKLHLAIPKKFDHEKELKDLIENNLETIFYSKFIKSDFVIGSKHESKISTLALSKYSNPVMIEYQTTESSELINQSLLNLAWIKDHKEDFELAANAKFGEKVEIDWCDIRVICIAPGYKKFDLQAVKLMGANIELWEYRLFDNGSFYLEDIFHRTFE